MRRTLPAIVVLALIGPVALRALAAAPPAPSSSLPPPTPVPPHGSPSPFPTSLATPVPTLRTPHVGGRSAILEDLDTGQVLYARRPDAPRPIASLTKIMTAYLTLRHLRPSAKVTIGAEAAQLGAHKVGLSELGLREGERLSVKQLLEALLLQSANDSAVALADAVSPSTDAFVALMNRTAKRFGLGGTTFRSPNGLDDRGHSTARSLAAITRRAERIPLFARLVRTKFAAIPAPNDRPTRMIQNRNVLLWLYPDAIGVKTGYTAKAGYCLVAAANVGGERLLAVILDDTSSGASFSDAATLLNYGYHSFLPEQVIKENQAFTTTSGGMRYEVLATRDVTAWVSASEHGAPSYAVTLPTTAPTKPGAPAGTVTARVRHLVVGRVPVTLAAVLGPVHPPRPPFPTPPQPRWWTRGASSLGGLATDLYHSVFG